MSDVEDGRFRALASLAGESGSGGMVQPTARSWEKFSQWVCCMCVVTFDLELGQAIEVSVSPGYL